MKACALVAAAALLVGCGGDKPPDPRPVVQRYFDAVGRGDAAAACATMTESSQAKLAQFGRDQLRLADADCGATIGALLASRFGAALRDRARRSRTTAVDVAGNHATITATGANAPLKLRLEHGAWLIDSAPTGETD